MLEIGKSVCGKPWCKATFPVYEDDVRVEDNGLQVFPEFCPKCVSQESSVTWENKTYEGDRWDGTQHQFTYKIKKYY